MQNLFSARLAALRKERGLTQKEAANQLGISAALLSHYEKGIRECGLSFLCKAAAFYDVSCDYLLGVSENRHAFEEEFDEHDTAQDKELRTGTLFRAAAMLNDHFTAAGSTPDKLRSYFALSLYRVTVQAVQAGVLPQGWIHLPRDAAEAFSAAGMDFILRTRLCPNEGHAQKSAAEPACIKTIIDSSEQFLQEEFTQILKSNPNNFRT